MRKKVLALMLAIVASVGTMFAWDYEHVLIGDLYYNLDVTNQIAEVTCEEAGSDNNYSELTTANIPATVSSGMTYRVTSIGGSAFSGCSGLTSMTIPNGITSIEYYAFSGCSSLTSVTIPNSVTSIGDHAFRGCSGLTSIVVDNGNTTYDSRNNCNAIVETATNTLILGSKNTTIPNSVTSIGSSAFYGCSGLTSITIPNGVTSIGSSAFYGCSGLTSIEIPNSVTSINGSVFSGCSGLTSIEIPNSVTSIGGSAFHSCTSLTSIEIPNSVTSIKSSAFANCSGLTSITIPNGVTSIKSSAFANCSGLTSVTIPNSVTHIGESAFKSCTQLSSVSIPEGVTYIEVFAFRNCSILSSVTLPSSLETLGYGVFEGTALYNDPSNWENGVLYVDTWVVDMKPNMLPSSYSIKNGTTGIAMNAFYDCENLQTIYIPSSVRYVNSQAFLSSKALSSVIFADKAPNEVGTIIENSAFSGCSLLTNVVLGNGVSVIGESAFKNCVSLSSINIPNSVTLIEYSAFKGCTSLPVINNIRYADNFLVEVADKTLNFYTIKENTKWIGRSAFENCTNITSISIPSSVISIGSSAFSKCTLLKNIISLATVPPAISTNTFSNIDEDAVVYVPIFNTSLYMAANYWKRMNIQQYVDSQMVSHATNVDIIFNSDIIASCGLEGGEQQSGNILEYIGLEPNSEYNNVPVVLTANTGETDTINISFSTTALELTTKEPKAVSSTTALLFAETNMSDAETSCGFEWKRENAPDAMPGTKVYCPVANGQMAGRLKNLKDDVYYKYRAFYQSAAGNMFYGDWQYIFTGDATMEFDPVLYTYGATVIHESEATISGYALAGSEDFDEQGFEYWAESRVSEEASAPARMPAALGEHSYVQASGIRMSVTLTNLDAGTVYKYHAYGKVGEQYFYGSEQTFTTMGVYEDEATAIEDIVSSSFQGEVSKILRDGQILILRGRKAYTITGQEVR